MKKTQQGTLLIHVLKGEAVYDISKSIDTQMAFIQTVKDKMGNQKGSEYKTSEAYLNQQYGKLNTMLEFINDAVFQTTGEYYQSSITSSLEDFDIKLLITPKQGRKQ